MFHSAASPAAPSFAHRSAILLPSILLRPGTQRNSVFHPSSRSWRSVRSIQRASHWVAVPDFLGVGQTGDSLRISDTGEKSCSVLSVVPCRCEPHLDGIELGIEDLSANTYAYSSPLHMDLYLSRYLFLRPPYPTVVAAHFACSSPAPIESTTHPVSLHRFAQGNARDFDEASGMATDRVRGTINIYCCARGASRLEPLQLSSASTTPCIHGKTYYGRPENRQTGRFPTNAVRPSSYRYATDTPRTIQQTSPPKKYHNIRTRSVTGFKFHEQLYQHQAPPTHVRERASAWKDPSLVIFGQDCRCRLP
jgi:hypothetical protein